MQAVIELDSENLTDGFVTRTTVTVAARAAPGGATGTGEERPRRLARRVRKDIVLE
jgi:hypothetical protein